jgi:hypothetical protein
MKNKILCLIGKHSLGSKLILGNHMFEKQKIRVLQICTCCRKEIVVDQLLKD